MPMVLAILMTPLRLGAKMRATSRRGDMGGWEPPGGKVPSVGEISPHMGARGGQTQRAPAPAPGIRQARVKVVPMPGQLTGAAQHPQHFRNRRALERPRASTAHRLGDGTGSPALSASATTARATPTAVGRSARPRRPRR